MSEGVGPGDDDGGLWHESVISVRRVAEDADHALVQGPSELVDIESLLRSVAWVEFRTRSCKGKIILSV